MKRIGGAQPERRIGDGRPRIAADQRVGRTRWQSQPPRDQIPGYGADEPRHDHVGRDELDVDEALAHRPGHSGAERERRDEVEERRPQDRLKRRQDASRHHRGHRVRGVMEAVYEIERQRDLDDEDCEC